MLPLSPFVTKPAGVGIIVGVGLAAGAAVAAAAAVGATVGAGVVAAPQATNARPAPVMAAPAPAVAAAPAPAPAKPVATRTVNLSSAPTEAAPAIDTAKFRKLEKAHGKPDDLELIGGIGPTIAKKLNALGIFHFWQIAAMTTDDIASVEHDVGFSGRAERDEWKAQASELMAGKPPRAKVDQDKAAKKPK